MAPNCVSKVIVISIAYKSYEIFQINNQYSQYVFHKNTSHIKTHKDFKKLLNYK